MLPLSTINKFHCCNNSTMARFYEAFVNGKLPSSDKSFVKTLQHIIICEVQLCNYNRGNKLSGQIRKTALCLTPQAI